MISKSIFIKWVLHHWWFLVSHLSRTVQGLLLEKKKRKEKKEKTLLVSFVKSAAGSQEHVFSVVVPFIGITFVQWNFLIIFWKHTNIDSSFPKTLVEWRKGEEGSLLLYDIWCLLHAHIKAFGVLFLFCFIHPGPWESGICIFPT